MVTGPWRGGRRRITTNTALLRGIGTGRIFAHHPHHLPPHHYLPPPTPHLPTCGRPFLRTATTTPTTPAHFTTTRTWTRQPPPQPPPPHTAAPSRCPTTTHHTHLPLHTPPAPCPHHLPPLAHYLHRLLQRACFHAAAARLSAPCTFCHHPSPHHAPCHCQPRLPRHCARRLLHSTACYLASLVLLSHLPPHLPLPHLHPGQGSLPYLQDGTVTRCSASCLLPAKQLQPCICFLPSCAKIMHAG